MIGYCLHLTWDESIALGVTLSVLYVGARLVIDAWWRKTQGPWL